MRGNQAMLMNHVVTDARVLNGNAHVISDTEPIDFVSTCRFWFQVVMSYVCFFYTFYNKDTQQQRQRFTTLH